MDALWNLHQKDNSLQLWAEMQTIKYTLLRGGIVQVEDADNWKWFIERVKSDLDLKNGEGFTLISDKQKVTSLLIFNTFSITFSHFLIFQTHFLIFNIFSNAFSP